MKERRGTLSAIVIACSDRMIVAQMWFVDRVVRRSVVIRDDR